MIATTNLPISKCPTCGYELDSASEMVHIAHKDIKPARGDFSLCFKCGEVLVFGEDLTLHLATLAELMDADCENMAAITLIQDKIRKERPLG